jgi:hypothetical protein
MNIECKKKDGKVHTVAKRLNDGTNIMNCGLAQQKPFRNSKIKGPVCYGKWEVTTNAATCKKCMKVNRKHNS